MVSCSMAHRSVRRAEVPQQQSTPDIKQTFDADLIKHVDTLHDLLEPLPAVTLKELLAGGCDQIDLLNIIQGKYKDDMVMVIVSFVFQLSKPEIA